MKIIRIKELYPETTDTQNLCIVTDDVNDVFVISKKEETAHKRKEYRYKAQYSLNCDNGIENAIVILVPSAEDVFMQKMDELAVRIALQKLTKKQFRRIYAHFYIGLSYSQIARIEGVGRSTIKESIDSSLKKISKILKFF